jgi:hypothetical protein
MADGKPAFYVMERECDQCLFGANRIVSGQRVKDVLQSCEREGKHFVCHKVSVGCCRASTTASRTTGPSVPCGRGRAWVGRNFLNNSSRPGRRFNDGSVVRDAEESGVVASAAAHVGCLVETEVQALSTD